MKAKEKIAKILARHAKLRQYRIEKNDHITCKILDLAASHFETPSKINKEEFTRKYHELGAKMVDVPAERFVLGLCK
jgi:hypothetical protein